MDNPPMMVVLTPAEPIWIPPRAALLVPMAMVVVPVPVPRLTVEDVPMPRFRVWLAVELPTVMAPVPCGAPMVRAPLSEAGFTLVTEMLVPVALVKERLPSKLVKPEISKLVEVTLSAVKPTKSVVEVKTIDPATNCINEVPVTEVPFR